MEQSTGAIDAAQPGYGIIHRLPYAVPVTPGDQRAELILACDIRMAQLLAALDDILPGGIRLKHIDQPQREAQITVVLENVKTKAQVKGTLSRKHVIRIPGAMGVMQVLPGKENPDIGIDPVQHFPFPEN